MSKGSDRQPLSSGINSSTSASRLMQTGSNSGTLKISQKGSKQLNQFRYGPVKASMPLTSSIADSTVNSSFSQKRAMGQSAKSPVSANTVKNRPNSSKPIQQKKNSDFLDLSKDLDRMNTSVGGRPTTAGNRPPSPGMNGASNNA